MDQYPWYKHYEVGFGPPLVYPENSSVYDLFQETAAKYPNLTATIFMGARMSFAQLSQQVDRMAAALAQLGIKKQDRVAVMLPNCPQYVISYLAILRLGAVVVQVNPLYTEREVENILTDSGAKIAVVIDLMYPRVEKIRSQTSLSHLIFTRVSEYLPFPINYLYPLLAKRKGQYPQIKTSPSTINFSELIRNTSGLPPKVLIDAASDIAVFQYTGGTTGTPKAAMLTHRNLVADTYMSRAIVGSALKEGEERVLAVLPFFHSFGLTTTLNLAIAFGSTLICIPRFEVKAVLKAIDKYRPTAFPGVPTMYVALNNYPELHRYDIKSIRVMISGAAAMPVEVLRQFEAKTGGVICEGYGLSEASPVVCCNPCVGVRKPGSIGIPLVGTVCRVVDLETGTRELAPGEVGELIVKGPQVMKGYWNRPEDTAHSLRDGWLYTGDVAKMDEDGYFYIVDRKKDMIITGGFNVYPREVEEVLYEHPKIKEAAVVGVPDEYSGERVKAVVVPKEGETLSEEEVIQWCRQKLTGYKVPRFVEFRDELPLSLVGKVLRRALKEEEQN